jgi:predicted DsbA family dithiol-disulfide isomerase
MTVSDNWAHLMSVILYSDFNCPFCYAMHERLYEMNLLDRCEWRGVQHAPHLSKPMARWSGTLAAELRHEVTLVQRLAPRVPISLPPGKPNTRDAIELAAALLRQEVGRGMECVREAYRLFWCAGQDLSDPAVLDRLAKASGGQPAAIGPGAASPMQVMSQWEEQWRATGESGVPLLAPDGRVVVGLVSQDDIRQFMP